MSKYIWIISSGQYSDYSVHAAYLTKDEAEAARDVLNEAFGASYYDAVGVETLPLNPELPSFKDGFAWWHVNFRNGAWSARESSSVYRIGEEGRVTKSGVVGSDQGYHVSLIADTEERALKAGTERIMQFIASE